MRIVLNPKGPIVRRHLSFFSHNNIIALIIIIYVIILLIIKKAGYLVPFISPRLVSSGGGKKVPRKASILLLKVLAIKLSGFLKKKNLKISFSFPFYSLPYLASF